MTAYHTSQEFTKEKLKKNLVKDTEIEAILLRALENIENLSDGYFQGDYGVYTIDEEHIGGNLFADGKMDSPENIAEAIEFSLITKVAFGDDELFYQTTNSQDADIMAYIAEKIDLNAINEGAHPENLSQALKDIIDTQLIEMNAVKAPELALTQTLEKNNTEFKQDETFKPAMLNA